jgi:16S rRNA (guanine966-N2)-methyltransferase
MGNLRVISGLARGRKLHSVPGDTTRPITDRVKESLFNIIGKDIQEASFLDLFAGTGSVGIEALSRYAEFVRFVDKDYLAIKTIHTNLDTTGLGSQSEVIKMDSFSILENRPDRRFDYIYLAPPQYKGLWIRALLALDKNIGWISKDGWVVVQIHPVEYKNLSESGELIHLVEFDQRKYGSTLLVFYRIPE